MTFYEALLGIDIPADFGIYEESDGVTPETENYIDKVYDLANEYHIEIDHAYGVSQLCFIIKGAPAVIKIGFKGMVEEWTEYDDNNEEICHEEFQPFSFDYCNKAYEIYNLAYEESIEEFFAKMDILGQTFTKEPIWTQDFVIPMSESRHSSKSASEDSLKRAKELEQEKYIPFEREWIALAIDLYGERKVEKLLAFLDENDIHDFHNGNYGYTKDGRPMLLDYSSWD